MKLNKIYISAFGKLKDFTLELSDGLNVIYGENENGKSTVMAFIKMMFYGSGKSTQNLAKSPRRKYAPWDGSQPAGSIEFEHSGRHYRLERTFGSSNSSDKVFLCDLDLGTRSSVSPDIGNEFFSLSMPAFERSVFIEGAGGFDNSSEADGEINSKLSNLVASGDENVSYAKILKRLDDARFALIGKSGRTGEYIKLNSTLDELKISLNTALQKKEHSKAIKEKIDALAKEIASLEAKAQDFKKIVDSESDIKNAGKLKEMLSLKERLDEINKSLLLNDGNIADEMFANKLVFCISKIENAQQKISDKTKECETLKETIELAQNPDTEISPENAQKTELQLNKAISEAKNYTLLCEQKKKEIEDLSTLKVKQKSKKKAFNTPSLILAALSLVAFIALFILKFSFSYAFLAVFAVFTVFSFTVRPENKKYLETERKADRLTAELEELDKKLMEALSKKEMLTSKLETINNFLNSNTAVIEHQKALLEESSKQLEKLFKEADEQKNILFSLYSRYSDCKDLDLIKQSLEKIKKQAALQKEIKQQLNYIAKDIGNISYSEAAEKIKAIPESEELAGTDFEAVKSEYETVRALISDKKSEVSALFAEYKSTSASVGSVEQIKEKIAKTEEKADLLKAFYDKASLAAEVLTESFAEIRSCYGGVLEAKATEIFSGLTAGRYKKINISKSFDLSVEHSEYFGGKEAEYLSSGAYDQAYLSLRLALSSLITADGEPLPVILDDPFVNYDDIRTLAAAEYLQGFSQSLQTVLFTCHSSDSDAAQKAGARIIIFNS